MSGRSSQAKGRRGEIELARYLQAQGYADARPGDPLNYGTQPDITGIDGLHIECKRHEKLEISKWYTQARADAARMRDGKPAVIYRRNREQWMIVLSLADFLAMNGGRSDNISDRQDLSDTQQHRQQRKAPDPYQLEQEPGKAGSEDMAHR